MEETFESKEATVVTRSSAAAQLAASPFLLTLLSILAGAFINERFYGAAILSFILGVLSSGLVAAINPFAKRDASGVTANQHGLKTAAGMSIPREELSQGFVVPHRHGFRVRLSRKGARLPVDVVVPSEAEGARLLKALELDATHSIASFFGMSRVYASRGGFLANVALLVLGPALLGVTAAMLHAPAIGFAALAVGVLAYVSFFMPMRLKVGGDGMVVSWYGRKRFIAYGDVESATRYQRDFGNTVIAGVQITMRGGEVINVPLSYGIWGGDRGAIAAERIREAMDAYARGDESAEAAMLARGDKTASEWILALRQIGAGANAGPRTAAIANDTLWRIVESGSTKPSVRAAAAVALAPTLDKNERARLGTIAEGTMAPKLRIAINAAAAEEEDEAAVAEALGELEAEERAKA